MTAVALRSRLRVCFAGAAVVTAALVADFAREDRESRSALVTRGHDAGLTGRHLAEAAAAIRREHDPFERQIVLARVLFAMRETPGAARLQPRLGRLDASEALAREALAGLPASWEAASLLGSARFESLQLRRDTRLFSQAERWEIPLFAAVARSSGSPLVERLLAAAYLEVWPAMSEGRRSQAAETLRRSFTQGPFVTRHLESWVKVAGSYDLAAELLPQTAQIARSLSTLALRRGESRVAERFAQLARSRLLDEMRTRIAAALKPGSERWRSAELLQAIEEAPFGLDFALLVGQAIEQADLSMASPRFSEAAERWLLWAEPLCLLHECPFGAEATRRLNAAAATRLGSPNTAFQHLAAGDTAKAAALARRAGALRSDDWTPYLLLLAKRQLDGGDAASALRTLASVREGMQFRSTHRRLLERARGGERGRAGTGVSPAEPGAANLWGAGEWRMPGFSSELELVTDRAADGIRIEFEQPANRRYLVHIELDGEVVRSIVVEHLARQLDLTLPVAPGPHLLRLTPNEGRPPLVRHARLV